MKSRERSAPCDIPQDHFAWARALPCEMERSTRLLNFVDSMPKGIGSECIRCGIERERSESTESLHSLEQSGPFGGRVLFSASAWPPKG